MDGIPLALLENFGLPSVVALVVYMLLTRRIVPLGALRDEQKTAEYWRSVATSKDATITTHASTIATQADTIKELTAVGETISKVMAELQRARDGSDA